MKVAQQKQANAYLQSIPKMRDDADFRALSESAQQVVWHRDVECASWFVQQRTWRVGDWVEVLKRKDWLDALWESKELWAYHRMDWARTLFAKCTGQHWGPKLGLYLTLMEHVPTGQ
eukprot:2065570-Pleurochrysis_carterae.AAC.1